MQRMSALRQMRPSPASFPAFGSFEGLQKATARS
jgi:hypothetical protein